MKEIIIPGILISIFLAAFLSPIASSYPDGLEKVAEDKGFLQKGEESDLKSPIPDYNFPFIKNEKVATAVAGLLGTILTFAIAYSIGVILGKRE